MKQAIIKKSLGTVVFILVLALVLQLISFAFAPQKTNIAMQDVLPSGLLAEQDNTIDVLFFGDSEAYAAFSPLQIWKDSGIPCYVCASSAQYISLTENFVYKALEHQKPKLIILETNAFYRKMLSDNAFLTRVENMFSILQYHNRWKNLCPIKLESGEQFSWKDDLKGYKFGKLTTKGKQKQHIKKTNEIAQIPSTNTAYVERIVSFCQAKNIQVLFISTPSTKNWNYARHNAVTAFAKQIGAQYLDLNLEKSVDIDWKTDSLDGGDHLNYRGATKVSSFLADYFAAQYQLPNRQTEKTYESWNDLIITYDMLIEQAEKE